MAGSNLSSDAVRFLHEATEALTRGDAGVALRAASEACHRAPDAPQPHYVYGQAWLACHDPARAVQAFAAALQLAPRWADAWVNYGVARYRQGAIEEAKRAMREALVAAPDHPAAASNLGAFMRITGDPGGAETLLRALVAREPDNHGARLNLAADLLQEERATDALALLDAVALPADPEVARHWHLQHALASLQLRQPAAARARLDALAALGTLPDALAPLWHWRRVLLAVLEHDGAQAVREAEAMEAALGATQAVVPEHRIMAHYDLAKFWSGHDAAHRAFSHWVEGHALLKQSQPFSRREHRGLIEVQIATFPRERFERGARASNDDPAPVFVVGMPRSGTTLCEQIIAAHAQGHGAGERGTLSQAFAGLGGGLDTEAIARVGSLEAAALDGAAAAYLAELHALAPDKTRIVDKMPGNYLHLGLVGLMLPGAKIIHCTRDPRDIGLSIFTFRFHGVHAYAHDLGDLGWTIAQQSRLMEHWRAVLPNPILTIALADWIEDFDGTLARVLAHLDLPPDAACARFHEREDRVRTVSRAQVRQPVNARGIGRWRAYAEDLAPLIAELAEADMLPGAVSKP